MNYRTLVCAGVLASLGMGSAAFAQDWHGDRDGRNQYERRDDRGGDRRDERNAARHDPRNVERHDDRRDERAMGNRDARDHRDHDRYEQRRDQYSYGARGPEWRRGGHVPPEYRNRQYVVEDWRGHRLHAPPRGYQWVQVGGDYALVSIGNGVIAQLVLSP